MNIIIKKLNGETIRIDDVESINFVDNKLKNVNAKLDLNSPDYEMRDGTKVFLFETSKYKLLTMVRQPFSSMYNVILYILKSKDCKIQDIILSKTIKDMEEKITKILEEEN